MTEELSNDLVTIDAIQSNSNWMTI